jgi:hypothetical protein
MVFRGLGMLIDWAAVLLVWISIGIVMPPAGSARLLIAFVPHKKYTARLAAV